jgi:very-short-patch-repair endonuclease
VFNRRELRGLGIDRNTIAREVAAHRWKIHGKVTIATHTGELSIAAQRWRAVWEVGSGAALDGVTSLQAAGLTSFDEERLHVSVPHSGHTPVVPGVRGHRLVTRVAGEVVDAGIPRVRPHVAAIRAAHWAVSDRQAALILCMTVQQRLAAPRQLADAQKRVRIRGRAGLVGQMIRDLAGGAQSLGELDFGRLCREHGLPEPSRQVVREGPSGRIYLDVRWDAVALVVEIDGAQHRQGLAVTADNLRRNQLGIEGELVLTIDLIGLRVQPSAFMQQVIDAFTYLSRRPSR